MQLYLPLVICYFNVSRTITRAILQTVDIISDDIEQVITITTIIILVPYI